MKHLWTQYDHDVYEWHCTKCHGVVTICDGGTPDENGCPQQYKTYVILVPAVPPVPPDGAGMDHYSVGDERKEITLLSMVVDHWVSTGIDNALVAHAFLYTDDHEFELSSWWDTSKDIWEAWRNEWNGEIWEGVPEEEEESDWSGELWTVPEEEDEEKGVENVD